MLSVEQPEAPHRSRRKKRSRRREPAPLKTLLIPAVSGLVVIAGTIAPCWFLSAAVCNAVGPEETLNALARVLLLASGTISCALAGLWSYRESHRFLIAIPFVLVGVLAAGHVRRGWNVRREALLLLAAAGLGFAANAFAWATAPKC